MRDDVAMQRRLSLAERIHKLKYGPDIITRDANSLSWAKLW